MGRGDPRLPPGDLAARKLDGVIRPLFGKFWRISRAGDPLIDWSGKPGARFSHPSLPNRVLYVSPRKATAFWERFGDEILDQMPGSCAISERLLSERIWKTVTVTARLRALDLTDVATLRRIGADGATFLAPYPITRQWAACFMTHPSAIDAVLYASRLDSRQKCVAIFERPNTVAALGVRQSGPPPVDDSEVLSILAKHGVSLV